MGLSESSSRIFRWEFDVGPLYQNNKAMAGEPSIQVDMFEVQLGAALLLQMRDEEGKPVRILADAGVKASGYSNDHVLKKLPQAIRSFAQDETWSKFHIDLMIGTHYDADHLDGLVPIILDKNVVIKEAWLPPVADDSPGQGIGAPGGAPSMLAERFQREDGQAQLDSYLQEQLRVCDELRAVEQQAEELLTERQAFAGGRIQRRTAPVRSRDGATDLLESFRYHIEDASQTLGENGHSHADERFDIEEEAEEETPGQGYITLFESALRRDHVAFFESAWRDNTAKALVDYNNFAILRQVTAKKAINANALAKVAMALRSRRVPTYFRTIPDGTPVHYAWDGLSFKAVSKKPTAGVSFALLGPSVGLVRKHSAVLPMLEMARAMRLEIPIKPITPSNQLSYILRLEAHGQGMLVTGDAGCVDFKPTPRGQYHQALLDALLPLQVIQVAHHAGYNAHFYRVLIDAKYPAYKRGSYLLLSHAVDDKTRPSDEFTLFMQNVGVDANGPKLLFTSRPIASRVAAFQSLIHPSISPGEHEPDKGDVRLTYDSAGWRVDSHSVRI
jgi:hypothetical protein